MPARDGAREPLYRSLFSCSVDPTPLEVTVDLVCRPEALACVRVAPAAMEAELETERDYRRQVRRAYYKREEDFPTLKEYNDYLEEVEDLVGLLLDPKERAKGRAQLDALRVTNNEVTARNRAKLEAEKRAMSDAIATGAQEAQQRAQERRDAEEQAAEQQRAQRQEIQDQIAEGRTSAATAQAELALRRKEAQVQGHAPSAVKQEQPGGSGHGHGYQYMPSAQQARGGGTSALAQPLEPQPSAEQQPPRLIFARFAAKEEYELDPTRKHQAQVAGGWRFDELWQRRYREEAFDAAALLFPQPMTASCR